MPLGATEIVGLLGAGLITYNFPNTRCIMQVVCCVPAVIGSSLIYALPHSNPTGRLVGFYIVNFTNGVLTMVWSLATSNVAGHTKRVTNGAFMFVGYSVGFIVGPQFFKSTEAPNYPTAFKTMVICFSISCAAPPFYYAYITWLNKSRAKKLLATGEANVVIKNEEFYDLTDKEQHHFVYVK